MEAKFGKATGQLGVPKVWTDSHGSLVGKAPILYCFLSRLCMIVYDCGGPIWVVTFRDPHEHQ